jgi:methionine-rich copper-binding protein CopC
MTAVGVFGVVTPAWAHTHLASSSPAQGAALAGPPSEVKLTFGEAVTLPKNPISVAGPGGATWTVGTASIAGAVVTAPVTSATGPAGAYVLTYRVTADDGDAVTGTVRFTLTAPAAAPADVAPAAVAPAAATPGGGAAATEAAPASAPQPATEPSSGGVPAWVWVLLAVIVAGAGAALARARRS